MPKPPENPDELARIAAAVRQLREERRLSQHELAAAAGVRVSRIQALELGRVDLDYVLLVRLARALGVRPSALILRAEGRASKDGPGRASEDGPIDSPS